MSDWMTTIKDLFSTKDDSSLKGAFTSTGGLLALMGGAAAGYLTGGIGGILLGLVGGAGISLLAGKMEDLFRNPKDRLPTTAYSPPKVNLTPDPDVVKLSEEIKATVTNPATGEKKTIGARVAKPHLERLKELDFEIGTLMQDMRKYESMINDPKNQKDLKELLDQRFKAASKLEVNYNEYLRVAEDYNAREFPRLQQVHQTLIAERDQLMGTTRGGNEPQPLALPTPVTHPVSNEMVMPGEYKHSREVANTPVVIPQPSTTQTIIRGGIITSLLGPAAPLVGELAPELLPDILKPDVPQNPAATPLTMQSVDESAARPFPIRKDRKFYSDNQNNPIDQKLYGAGSKGEKLFVENPGGYSNETDADTRKAAWAELPYVAKVQFVEEKLADEYKTKMATLSKTLLSMPPGELESWINNNLRKTLLGGGVLWATSFSASDATSESIGYQNSVDMYNRLERALQIGRPGAAELTALADKAIEKASNPATKAEWQKFKEMIPLFEQRSLSGQAMNSLTKDIRAKNIFVGTHLKPHVEKVENFEKHIGGLQKEVETLRAKVTPLRAEAVKRLEAVFGTGTVVTENGKPMFAVTGPEAKELALHLKKHVKGMELHPTKDGFQIDVDAFIKREGGMPVGVNDAMVKSMEAEKIAFQNMLKPREESRKVVRKRLSAMFGQEELGLHINGNGRASVLLPTDNPSETYARLALIMNNTGMGDSDLSYAGKGIAFPVDAFINPKSGMIDEKLLHKIETAGNELQLAWKPTARTGVQIAATSGFTGTSDHLRAQTQEASRQKLEARLKEIFGSGKLTVDANDGVFYIVKPSDQQAFGRLQGTIKKHGLLIGTGGNPTEMSLFFDDLIDPVNGNINEQALLKIEKAKDDLQQALKPSTPSVQPSTTTTINSAPAEVLATTPDVRLQSRDEMVRQLKIIFGTGELYVNPTGRASFFLKTADAGEVCERLNKTLKEKQIDIEEARTAVLKNGKGVLLPIDDFIDAQDGGIKKELLYKMIAEEGALQSAWKPKGSLEALVGTGANADPGATVLPMTTPVVPGPNVPMK